MWLEGTAPGRHAWGSGAQVSAGSTSGRVRFLTWSELDGIVSVGLSQNSVTAAGRTCQQQLGPPIGAQLSTVAAALTLAVDEAA